jgi:hypothetical protein
VGTPAEQISVLSNSSPGISRIGRDCGPAGEGGVVEFEGNGNRAGRNVEDDLAAQIVPGIDILDERLGVVEIDAGRRVGPRTAARRR